MKGTNFLPCDNNNLIPQMRFSYKLHQLYLKPCGFHHYIEFSDIERFIRCSFYRVLLIQLAKYCSTFGCLLVIIHYYINSTIYDNQDKHKHCIISTNITLSLYQNQTRYGILRWYSWNQTQAGRQSISHACP